MNLQLIKDRDPALFKHIVSGLYENLNYPKWKRVEAGRNRIADGVDYPAAQKHFYEVVFPKKILDRISALTGMVFPEWGNSNEAGTVTYGGPIGIRWADGHDSLKGEKTNKPDGPRSVRVRNSVKGSSGPTQMRPQLIVTLRPSKTYELMRSPKYTVAIGTDRIRPNPKAIYAADWWKSSETKILPIRLTMPNLGFAAEDADGMGNGDWRDPVNTKKSAMYNPVADACPITDFVRELQAETRKEVLSW